MMPILSTGNRFLLRRLSLRIVPESVLLKEEEWVRVLAIIEGALSQQPVLMQDQFRIFLLVTRALAFLRYGCSFERLSESKQDRLLTWLQEGPVALFRKGFWGLKTMIFMGYYGRPQIGPSLHYHLLGTVRNSNDFLRPRV